MASGALGCQAVALIQAHNSLQSAQNGTGNFGDSEDYSNEGAMIYEQQKAKTYGTHHLPDRILPDLGTFGCGGWANGHQGNMEAEPA